MQFSAKTNSAKSKEGMVCLLLVELVQTAYIYATRLVCEESNQKGIGWFVVLELDMIRDANHPQLCHFDRPRHARTHSPICFSKKQQWHRLEAHSFQVPIIMYVYVHSHRSTSELF